MPTNPAPEDEFDAWADHVLALANENRTPGIEILGDAVEREMQRDEDRAAFERMLHPTSRSGLCDLAAGLGRWPE